MFEKLKTLAKTGRFLEPVQASNFGHKFLCLSFKVSNFPNVFKTRVLLSDKCCYFQPFCLPAKMVSETSQGLYYELGIPRSV